MRDNIKIILRKDFLDAALMPFIKNHSENFYSGKDTRELFDLIHPQLKGNEPYPVKYLFGWKQNRGETKGILRIYFEAGCKVEIFAADDGSGLIEEYMPTHCFYDVQFADVSPVAVQSAISCGQDIAGWTNPAFHSKSCQILFIAEKVDFALLPATIIIPSGVRPQKTSTVMDDIRDFFDSEYVILKSSHGAASRLTERLEYAVFPTSQLGFWIFELADAIEKEGRQDIILSEMLVTDDIFSGRAGNVVHKLNCYIRGGESVRLLGCKKVVSIVDFNKISEDYPTKLADIITDTYWTDGIISNVHGVQSFMDILTNISPCDWICTLDFMIPPDGMPRFLEINKFSDILADISLSDDCTMSAVDFYANSNIHHYCSGNIKNKIQNISGFCVDTFQRYLEQGIIFVSPKKGVKFTHLS